MHVDIQRDRNSSELTALPLQDHRDSDEAVRSQAQPLGNFTFTS